MTENIGTKDSIEYSRHLLKCIFKFLPNNPNFCPSFKDIENEPYFRSCVKNLISIYIDSDTDIIISDILKLLTDKLSKYEEFPKIDDEVDQSVSNPQTTSNFHINTDSKNAGFNTSSSMPITEHSHRMLSETFLDTKKSNIHHGNNNLSEATMKLMDKYSGIRKETKFPIRSLGISNYVLIFLKLMMHIFEVNYKFSKAYTPGTQASKDKKAEFENYFVGLFTKSNNPFYLLKTGIVKESSLPTNQNVSAIIKPNRLPSKTFRQLLKFLIAIKSTNKLDKCVEKIVAEDQLLLPNMKLLITKSLNTSSARNINNNNHMKVDDKTLESITDMNETRDKIDSYVEYLLSYIADSNKPEYMDFLEQILLINPGPEAFKDKFILEELQDKYTRTNDEHLELNSEQLINAELQNNDNIPLQAYGSNTSTNSEHNSKYVVIPAYLALFTSNFLFATEYISFVTFNDIKDLIKFIGFVHKLYKTFKRTIFRKCLLLAFSYALQSFLVLRTSEYFKFTHNNPSNECTILKKELTSIFNTIYSSFDALRLINDVHGNLSGSLMNHKLPGGSFPKTPQEKESSLGSHNSNTIDYFRKSMSYDYMSPSPDDTTSTESSNTFGSTLLPSDSELKDFLVNISKRGLVVSEPGNAYDFGITTIEDSLLNPNDTSILKSLTVISLFNVDVFSNYLNKVISKGLDVISKQDPNHSPSYSSHSGNNSPVNESSTTSHETTKHKGLSSFMNIIKNKDTSDHLNSEEYSTVSLSGHSDNHSKNMGQSFRNNILKMPKIQTYYSSNKETKFWSGVIKLFTGSQSGDVNDKSIILILNSLMTLHAAGGILNIQSCDSPIVTFALRLGTSFDQLFSLEEKVSEVSKYLVHTKNVLERNRLSKAKLIVEKTACSLMLTPLISLEMMEQVYKKIEEITNFNFEYTFKLYSMSEALRFFFHIPDKIIERDQIFNRTMILIKKITFLISDKTLNNIPFLQKDASKIIDNVIFLDHEFDTQVIDYFIGKRNDKFVKKFNEAVDKDLSTEEIFTFMMQDKDHLEKELIESSLASEDLGKSKLKTLIVDENNLQLSDVEHFLTNSLIANSISIMKAALDFKNIDFLNQSFNKDLKKVEKILLCGLLSSDTHLVDEAISCYKTYLINILAYSSGAANRIFYESAGVSLTLLTVTIFNLNCPETIRFSIMQIIIEILNMRKQINQVVFESIKDSELTKREKLVITHMPNILFRSIMVNLSFSDVKTHEILKSLCGFYQHEVEVHCKYFGISEGINDMFCIDLAKAISNYSSIYGPIAFQRHLRSDITKNITHATKTLVDCFLVLCDKVFDMMVVGENNMSRDDQVRYRNYSGILASFIGIFKVGFLTDNEDKSFSTYAVVIDKNIDFFVEKYCDLLSSSDLVIRENSKDLLSLELHPGVYAILFKTILKKLEAFETEYSTKKEKSNPFILEQIMTVMRLIFERKDITLIILSYKSVIEIFDKVFTIIHMMDSNSPFKYKSIMYICKAVDSFQHAENYFYTSGAYVVKNRWLTFIFNWFNEVAFVELDLINLTKSHREMDMVKRDFDYLRLDTAIECVKALNYLSENFTLEAPAATTTDDLEITKKSVLSNFFNVLLKALKRSSDVDKVPFVLKHKTLILSDNILTCLKNLLNCSPTIGLDFILPIAYIDNGIMNKLMLDILIDLTKKVADDTNDMSEEQEDAVNGILKQFLKHSYLLRFLALQSPYNDLERFASSLLRIWSAKNITHVFIADLIEDEINHVSRNMDILRRNSLATRTLAIFSRVKGSEFLDNTINPLIDDVVVEGLDFEIEKYVEDPLEKEKQVKRFVTCIDKFVDNIEQFSYTLPEEFVYISQKIYQSAERKFPGSELMSVGSFIFLRFFCPAIVNPESTMIKDKISSKNRRTLILMAKFLQNLANQTISSLKWPLLENQKAKIDEWNTKVFDFLAKISSSDITVNIESNWSAPLGNLESVGTLHTLMYTNVTPMKIAMIETAVDKQSFDDLLETSKVLDDSLNKLGQPTFEVNNGIPDIIRNNAEKYSLVYDFMNRHFLKVGSKPEVNGLIVLSADSFGIPRINISLRLIESDKVDVNDVVYKLIFLESNLWTKKFSILFDGTAAFITDAGKIKKIMSSFLNLLPKDSFLHLENIVFYNISPIFLDFWKSQSVSAEGVFNMTDVKHKFITSNCPPQEFESLQLRQYSSDIYHDVRITLLNTSYYEPTRKRFVPVSLKIGNKNIQVINETPKRIKFSKVEGIVECFFNTMYYMCDVEEVKPSSETGVPCEFTIFFKSGFKLILSSPKYLEILKIILYAKNKLDESSHLPVVDIDVVPVKKNPKYDLDSLTKIFMVSLAGCSSKNPEIISRGFALYVTARKTFHLDYEFDAYPCIDITLPEDTTAVFRFIAEYLSSKHPEMTYHCIKNCTEGIISGLLHENILMVSSVCSYWIPNILEHVFFDTDNNGRERTIQLIRLMIKCTFLHSADAPAFKMFIWNKLLNVPEVLELIVDEIITFSMDKESEGADWKICTSILSSTLSIPISNLIIQRLLKLINNLVPSLTGDGNENSWSEVMILLSILQEMSFNANFLFERYIPEVLYILSVLIDVKPIKVKVSLLKILTNICYSFIQTTGNSPEKRQTLIESIEYLTSPKARFVFGLSRENSNSYYTSKAASLLLKVSHMSELITFMLKLMNTISKEQSRELLWKAKYKDLIVEAIFGEESYVSARAMIYLSILFKDFVYKDFMTNLFRITLKVFADISYSEESKLHVVTHIISYGNYAYAVDSANQEIITQLAWICHTSVMSTSLVFFHAGVIAATKSLEKLLLISEDGVKVSEMIWANDRAGLEKELYELESLDKRVSTPENMMIGNIHIVSKALMFSHTKESGLQFLRMLLKLIGNEAKDDLLGSGVFVSLLFITYLLEKKEKFDNVYEYYFPGTVLEYTFLKTGAQIPTFIIDWLDQGDDFTKNMTLYQISILMQIDILDEDIKCMILDIALYVIDTQPEVFFEYMISMKPHLEKLEEKVTNNTLVMKSFDLSMAITTSSLCSQKSIYEVKMDKRLKEMQMESIAKLDLLLDNAASEELENDFILTGLNRRRCYVNIFNKIIETMGSK